MDGGISGERKREMAGEEEGKEEKMEAWCARQQVPRIVSLEKYAS